MLFVSCLPCAAVGVDLQELRETVDIICDAAKLDSLEKLAFALEIDEAQLHRQLQGEGHFSLTRVVAKLAKGCPGFWPRLAWLMACRYGVPVEAWRSADLVLSVTNRSQLKMAADAPQKRLTR